MQVALSPSELAFVRCFGRLVERRTRPVPKSALIAVIGWLHRLVSTAISTQATAECCRKPLSHHRAAASSRRKSGSGKADISPPARQRSPSSAMPPAQLSPSIRHRAVDLSAPPRSERQPGNLVSERRAGPAGARSRLSAKPPSEALTGRTWRRRGGLQRVPTRSIYTGVSVLPAVSLPAE